MNTKLSCLVAALLANAALPGCGGSASSGAQPAQDSGAGTNADAASPSEDAGSGAAAEAGDGVDHGMPSDTYPAFKPDVGQLVDNGGYVMKQPVIVPITWNSDPAQATFDAFVDGLGASAYWQAIAKDYAVGAATSGTANHVHMSTAAPMTLTETMDASSDLVKLVTANAGKTWPAPTKDTLYAFFLPPGTSLLVNSGIGGGSPMDACSQGIGGYHSAVAATTAGANDIAYAVVPSCSFPGRVTVAEQTTMSMSHEIIEAATDPFSADQKAQNIGWYGFDSAHFGWTYFNELQSEDGDVCEFYKEAFFQDDSSFPYWVQRIWSNSSAAAGHHPCVPTPSGAYFNVTPLDMGHVNVTIPGVLTGGAAQTTATEGVRVLNGQSATFMIGFYSDGPTGGPWTISASSGNPILAAGGQDLLAQYNTSSIKATIDKTSGQNGEKAQVTVNVTTSGSLFKGELLTITSTLNGVSHYMPIWIGGE